MNKIINKLGKKCVGTINIPGDRSISIRVSLFANMFYGNFDIDNYNYCKDTETMMHCIYMLRKLDKKNVKLDCENSATTMRLLAGFISAMYMGQDIKFTLTGDKSLLSRPMDRIITPLKKMGADIKGFKKNGKITAPIYINCKTYNKLKDLDYKSNVSSAQVKSCLQIASLIAGTKLKYKEPFKSRNHTELMIKHFKSLHTHNDIPTFKYIVPSDISTASYFIANAIIYMGSNITMKNILVNETRTGFLKCLKKMGVNVDYNNENILQNEKVADIHIANKNGFTLKPLTLDKKMVPSLIDEIPLLAILLASAKGTSKLLGIEELRYKESDRIKATTDILKYLGIKYEEKNSLLTIYGNPLIFKTKTNKPIPSSLKNTKDHRILLLLKLLNIKGAKYNSYINVSI